MIEHQRSPASAIEVYRIVIADDSQYGSTRPFLERNMPPNTQVTHRCSNMDSLVLAHSMKTGGRHGEATRRAGARLGGFLGAGGIAGVRPVEIPRSSDPAHSS